MNRHDTRRFLSMLLMATGLTALWACGGLPGEDVLEAEPIADGSETEEQDSLAGVPRQAMATVFPRVQLQLPAPNYQGDIRIGFLKDAHTYWPAIVITRLPKGIHGVQTQMNGQWVTLRKNGDNGQSFQLPNGRGPYRIRVIDANDQLLKGGRVYEFSFPASCGTRCSALYTLVSYSVR